MKPSLKNWAEYPISRDRLFSASEEEIRAGLTTDIYFLRTLTILQAKGRENTPVYAEVFAAREGIVAGVEEVKRLLQGRKVHGTALPEGSPFAAKEVILTLEGPYAEFGALETPILGCLASSSGWATRAAECKRAAGAFPLLCFGSRHLHPSVAPVMERAALIGGADGVSCILAARLLGKEPSGTIPHACILIFGDTLDAAQAFDQVLPPGVPRIILVDTFKDEAEEALRLAQGLGEKLYGIRLDTASERGGVTPGLVAEVKARLVQKGYAVKVFVSGGLTPEKIDLLVKAGADGFGVGSYIAAAPPIDMTLDLKEVNGTPMAKRGRKPGRTPTPRHKPLFN